MSSNIFLSYASEQCDAASAIELSLKGSGHCVFRDRTSLPPGESFDARIVSAIEESDLFIFLISSASVSTGRYTLTELKFAEQKWSHPAGYVLPVLVEQVPKETIPAFLRAVTMLQPRGNLTAEIAVEVARMTTPWWLRMLKPGRLASTVTIALLIVLAATGLPDYFKRSNLERQAEELVKQSAVKAESGDSLEAWKVLEQAGAVAPHSAAVIDAQQRQAMESLRNAGVNFSRGDSSLYVDLTNRMAPVLTRGAALAQGERLADLLAHLGWADYLRQLAGGGAEPVQHYRRAVEVDPGNVYGHAMWGFELLRERRSASALSEAKQHFSAALESKREREYLRYLQVSAFLQSYTNVWIDDPEREVEALKVANAMRTNGERQPKGWEPSSLKNKLWSIYHFEVATQDALAALFVGLPAAEHLALFRWLFPEDDLPTDRGEEWLFNYLHVLAQLQERSGERANALSSYRRLLSEFADKGYNSSRSAKIIRDANAAIKRLNNAPS